MAKQKNKRTITIKIDVVKEMKRASRAKFGRPGHGRKTSHIDRKKQSNKEECREWRGEKDKEK